MCNPPPLPPPKQDQAKFMPAMAFDCEPSKREKKAVEDEVAVTMRSQGGW
jgi:hypothetical protein